MASKRSFIGTKGFSIFSEISPFYTTQDTFILLFCLAQILIPLCQCCRRILDIRTDNVFFPVLFFKSFFIFNELSLSFLFLWDRNSNRHNGLLLLPISLYIYKFTIRPCIQYCVRIFILLYWPYMSIFSTKSK